MLGLIPLFLDCAHTKAYWISRVSEEILKQKAERCVLGTGPCKGKLSLDLQGTVQLGCKWNQKWTKWIWPRYQRRFPQKISQNLPFSRVSSLVSSWKSSHLHFLTFHLFPIHHDQISNSKKPSGCLRDILIIATSDGHFWVLMFGSCW